MRHLLWILPLVLFLLLVIFVLFAKLKISVIINNKTIKVYVYKIKVFDSVKKKTKVKKDTPAKKEEEFERKYKGFKYFVNMIRRVFDDKNDDLLYILRHIRRTFNIRRLDLALDYGTGDAAVTGITSGALWILISKISAFVGRYVNIREILNVAVKLNYTEKVMDYRINFVFTARIYHLLQTIRLVLRFTKTLKGGK